MSFLANVIEMGIIDNTVIFGLCGTIVPVTLEYIVKIDFQKLIIGVLPDMGHISTRALTMPTGYRKL